MFVFVYMCMCVFVYMCVSVCVSTYSYTRIVLFVTAKPLSFARVLVRDGLCGVESDFGAARRPFLLRTALDAHPAGLARYVGKVLRVVAFFQS